MDSIGTLLPPEKGGVAYKIAVSQCFAKKYLDYCRNLILKQFRKDVTNLLRTVNLLY